jgi:hypothetical protein
VEDKDLKCICEHLHSFHQSAIPEAHLSPICFACCDVEEGYDPNHEFKLDNLSYIEALAKEKNLI